jgi:hypothetical protein
VAVARRGGAGAGRGAWASRRGGLAGRAELGAEIRHRGPELRLADDLRGADRERLDGQGRPLGGVRGDDDDARPTGRKLPQDVHAGEARHLHVQGEHVRARAPAELERLGAVGCRTDDLHRGRGERIGDQPAHQRRVVADDGRDPASGRMGIGERHRWPASQIAA